MRTKVGMMVLAAAAFATGCGDDDGAESAEGDVQRYCELVAELDAAGAEFFAELESDESATEEDFENAERQFVEEHQEEIAEVREAAPEEIADDIDVLIAAQEERAAGGEQEETPPEVAEAEERVEAFEAENCEAG